MDFLFYYLLTTVYCLPPGEIDVDVKTPGVEAAFNAAGVTPDVLGRDDAFY
jgi:hypothetical protein